MDEYDPLGEPDPLLDTLTKIVIKFGPDSIQVREMMDSHQQDEYLCEALETIIDIKKMLDEGIRAGL